MYSSSSHTSHHFTSLHHNKFMVLQVASPRAVKDLKANRVKEISVHIKTPLKHLRNLLDAPLKHHWNMLDGCMSPQLVDFNGFLLCFPGDLCDRNEQHSVWKSHQKVSESIPNRIILVNICRSNCFQHFSTIGNMNYVSPNFLLVETDTIHSFLLPSRRPTSDFFSRSDPAKSHSRILSWGSLAGLSM